jgi:hypothetical protein
VTVSNENNEIYVQVCMHKDGGILQKVMVQSAIQF